jgi:riboflavin synthase alpha subunit
MGVYTVSPDLLRNIEKDDGIYLTDILFVFTQRANTFKIAKDRKGEVINCYQSIKANGEIIKTIDVELDGLDCEETKFVKICKETQSQNKLITYTHQNLKKHSCRGGVVTFEGTDITVLDRDEAKQELTVVPKSGDTFINSQVAQNNSRIVDSTNE